MIEVSSIKLTDFNFIGDGMYAAKYLHRGLSGAVQSEFDGFLFLGDELF